MKVVILAGGLGTRLSEETEVRPKPMVEIGGLPILWHIMKTYAEQGHKEFYIALGYKGNQIKRFFLDYDQLGGDLTVNLGAGRTVFHEKDIEDWVIHLVDTGLDTNTGGRLKRLQRHLEDGTFMLTYGDGLCSVDLEQPLALHRRTGATVTLTAVRPPARFGGLNFEGDLVSEFVEKPQIGEGWINGGFMILEPGVFDYLHGDRDSLESDALENLSIDRKLAAYRHEGFWQCMDTLRDVRLVEQHWQSGSAPWKNWD
jgi:glucose-1-phosphate cytidylyltransferase